MLVEDYMVYRAGLMVIGNLLSVFSLSFAKFQVMC